MYAEPVNSSSMKYSVLAGTFVGPLEEAMSHVDPLANLYKRMIAEAGACEDKMRIARVAKERNLDAIHDTVHEMAKDEARHGKGFEGLYNRYFK